MVRGNSRLVRESGESKGEVVGGKTKEVPQWVVKNCQPGRRVERRGINPRECLSDRDLGEWIKDIGVTIAPLVPQGYRYLVLRGLWTGGDLDAQELHQIPVAGLIQQRVQVREGCVPYAARTRRRPSQYAEEWRKQYVSEGITCGMYERCLNNEYFSQWSTPVRILTWISQLTIRIFMMCCSEVNLSTILT